MVVELNIYIYIYIFKGKWQNKKQIQPNGRKRKWFDIYTLSNINLLPRWWLYAPLRFYLFFSNQMGNSKFIKGWWEAAASLLHVA